MTDRKPIGGLSPREVELLGYLRKYIKARAYAPSYAEICKDLSYSSKSNVSRVMGQLEERKLIERIAGRMRAIEITAAGLKVPLPEEAK